ncbi:hypothetical protein ABEB36_015404 [Hypothenemus hampei]|uniref:Kringle domain-containing protein n=1 Tax=Hypothenemus hampei TaxID=57062 RepID=A0ABD1E038_HYPHA
MLFIPLLISILIKWIQNEAPPGNLTDLDQCKLSHLGVEYTGSIGKTESNVRCQSWISNSPHKVNDSLVDDQFPYHSKKKSKNYCRNPDRKSSGPWCYTMNSDLIDETCTVPLCSYSECKLTGPGMEFGGFHNKGYSDRKCLKWDKNRKKVLENGTYKKYDKFPDNKFSDGTAAKAKNFCRNPDGDPGGPWCFVENELGYIEREYCDIEFCDDPECSLVAKDSITYMHFKNLNENVSEVKFGLKLWNSDSFDNASARIVLTVLALPLKSKDISDLGIGLELFISNKESALRYGNKDQPEYESTPGILTSSNFTKFILNWDRGFITLGLEGSIKPIFLAEINNKKNLMGHQRDHFNFYSLQGTDVIWNFPFCLEGCDVHTTTGGDFQQFIPLRQKDIVFDLYVYIRAFHSAAILFIPSPTVDYPYFKMVLSGPHGLTRFTLKEHHGATEIVLKEIQLEDVLDYWRWSEFSVSFFANSLQIYMKKAIGMHTLLESTNEMFRQLRWFSISSGNAVAHWTFFCLPPNSAQPPEALLPECAINTNEPDYEGTQAIISNTGLPCLPWSARNLIPFDVVNLFRNEIDLFEAKNYCRNPKSSSVNGTFCFVFFEGKILKQLCRLRKCKSQQCKMAGTGNDFIGHLNTTRSGRKCDKWDVSKESIHPDYMYSFNNSYFAEMNSTLAENFCRNPTRDISGSWCYTRDPQVVQDVCNVKDCDRPEELIIIISTNQDGRRIYVLPQWKEEGLHGGLKFSLKEWNPDLLSGIIFAIFSKDGTQELQLVIGAKMNEKVELILNKQLIESRTLPHLISAGIWTDFWLQMRKGEVLLGFRGVPTPLFEWRHQYKETAFEPTFLAYYSLFDTMPIGIVFQNDECHTENTTDNNFLKYIPIGLHSKTENHVRYNNLSMKLRGVGQCWISFLWVANSFNSYQIKIDTIQGTIGFYKVEAPPRSTKPKITPLIEKNSVQTMIATKWTSFMFSWTDKLFKIARNNESVLTYESERPILTYWFSVAAVEGWVTWSANCDPLDLDGPPIDGGWSQWSPWTCTVTCGGGEGFRTRTCSNPHPNIFGKLCQGNPTVTGVCNDFPCGDISPETLEEIQSNLKKHSYSFIVEEGTSIVLKNDQVMLKKIQKESPEAYFEWTLNGVFVTVNQRVSRQGDNVSIKNTRSQDSGIYVAMIYRPNGHRAVLRVITLAVKSKLYNVETRATWSYSLQCHSVILGYIYTDLSLKVMVDNRTYLDHGIVNLAAVNTHVLNNLNQTESGAWHCVVEQRDLKLKWTTNYIRINVKKKANFFTHIMEDKLTAPLFGYLNSEIAVVAVIITIVVLVFLGAVAFLMIYLKFCHLNARSRRNRRF